MNAIDVKKLIDFEMIMNIINLGFATGDAVVNTEFEFNGKKYTIEKGHDIYDEVRITRDDECELMIVYDYGMLDMKNPKILINYNTLGLHFSDYKTQAPNVHLWSKGFLVKNGSTDIAKTFDVQIDGCFGNIFFPLNEFDGSNIPMFADFESGAIIFDENGVRYRNYFISNDGKVLYKGEELPSEAELKAKEEVTYEDPTIYPSIVERLTFYKAEYKSIMNVLALRDRILNSGMKSYLFTKEEMFRIYLELYKALVESKEHNSAKNIG